MTPFALDPQTTQPWLCFGCGHLGTTLKGRDAEACVAAFAEAGGTFFDTAHVYAGWLPRGSGKSERELARILRVLGLRESAFVVTKGGHPAFGNHYRRPSDFLAERPLRRDVDDSRRRLGTDRLDLWLLHRDDATTPVEALAERCAALVQEGKVARFGVSNWSVARIRAFNQHADSQGLPRIVVSSVQASLAVPGFSVDTDPTMRTLHSEFVDFHRETGMPLLAWSASAGGWFAGKPEEGGPWDTPFNRAMRDEVRAEATRLGVDPAALALAWLRTLGFPAAACFGAGSARTVGSVCSADRVEIPPESAERWTRLRLGLQAD